MALSGKRAKLTFYAEPLSFIDEPTNSLADNQTYQIMDETKRIWCKDCDITVKNNDVEVNTGFTIDRLTGRIIFDTSDVRNITVNGEYLPMAAEVNAYEYTYTLNGSNEDATVFDSEFVQREQTLKDITASISRFYSIEREYLNQLLQDGDMIIDFYSSPTQQPDIRARVKVSTDEVSGAVDGLIEESIELEGTADKEGRVVTFGPFVI